MEPVFAAINSFLMAVDDAVWGVPLICLILFGGIFLTCRMGGLQFRQLGRALRYMLKNEKVRKGKFPALVHSVQHFLPQSELAISSALPLQ